MAQGAKPLFVDIAGPRGGDTKRRGGGIVRRKPAMLLLAIYLFCLHLLKSDERICCLVRDFVLPYLNPSLNLSPQAAPLQATSTLPESEKF